MKCTKITCENYNSSFFDNCSVMEQNASDCLDFVPAKGCDNCRFFQLYLGCGYLMECKEYSLWEGK